MQGNLGVERMCQLAEVSRASFYRSLKERAPAEEDVEVRSAIQQVTLEHRRRYGSRRVTAALRRRGMIVNRKRVARLMREDNLLAIQPRSFVVTTDSDHELEVYLNVASRMNVKGVNQLWVADITYIRLKTEFVYLAVILDAHSRKVVGWELDQTLATRLPFTALVRAIAKRKPRPGLVHHSDRGVQYASEDYTGMLKQHRATISMSRKGNPYDKDYASHCTSWVLCAMTWFTRRRWDSFTPCAFRGGLSPGCSNRQSFLSL
jgi:putative transposase